MGLQAWILRFAARRILFLGFLSKFSSLLAGGGNIRS